MIKRRVRHSPVRRREQHGVNQRVQNTHTFLLLNPAQVHIQTCRYLSAGYTACVGLPAWLYNGHGASKYICYLYLMNECVCAESMERKLQRRCVRSRSELEKSVDPVPKKKVKKEQVKSHNFGN